MTRASCSLPGQCRPSAADGGRRAGAGKAPDTDPAQRPSAEPGPAREPGPAAQPWPAREPGPAAQPWPARDPVPAAGAGMRVVPPEPDPAPPLAAIVLAGGRASRLGGADKPGLVVGGRTLLATAVGAATGAGAGHVVVVGPARTGLASGARATGSSCRVVFVREHPPGAGPVAALRRGLADIGAPVVAVLAA